MTCFRDYSWTLCSCAGVCAFEVGGNSPSLYWLASAGKACHQSVHTEILLKPSGGICRQAGLVPGSASGQAWCLGLQGPAWYLGLQEPTWILGPWGLDWCWGPQGRWVLTSLSFPQEEGASLHTGLARLEGGVMGILWNGLSYPLQCILSYLCAPFMCCNPSPRILSSYEVIFIHR